MTHDATKLRTALPLSVLLAFTAIASPCDAHEAEHAVARDAPETKARLRRELAAAATAMLDATDTEPGDIEKLYAYSRREALRFQFDSVERRNWSYWPRARQGLSLGRMNGDQRRRVHDILTSLLSARGYLQAVHIIGLEEVLASLETQGFARAAEDYTLAIFGEPAIDGPWGLRFEGHHLSVNLTVTPAAVFVTPSFFGAAPARRTSGALAGFAPLGYEGKLAFRLVRSLAPRQLETAILSTDVPGDILSTPFRSKDPERWQRLLTRGGLSGSEMSSVQLDFLDALLAAVFDNYRDEIAEAERARISLKDLHFAWMGTIDADRPHYFRIQGESFVYEYDAAQDNGNHVHTVWRNRDDDFGAATLQRHYHEQAH